MIFAEIVVRGFSLSEQINGCIQKSKNNDRIDTIAEFKERKKTRDASDDVPGDGEGPNPSPPVALGGVRVNGGLPGGRVELDGDD